MSNLTYWDYQSALWLFNLLKSSGLTEIAAAGVLGNIYQESAKICPFCVEGWESDYAKQWEITENQVRTTTTALEFANQTYRYGTKKGYGLAQWTEKSRKIAYWNYVYNGMDHTLLGNMTRDGNYLVHDLQTWSMTTSCDSSYWSAQGKTTWQWLSDPNVSLADAVKAVLMIYERPYLAIHGQANVEFDLRYGYAQDIYNDMTGQTPPPTPPPDPPTPPTPPIPPSSPGLPVWLLFKLKERGDM